MMKNLLRSQCVLLALLVTNPATAVTNGLLTTTVNELRN